MRRLREITRLAAAALFSVAACAAVLVSGAVRAGQPAGAFQAAPRPAEAEVRIAIGIGARGPYRYHRYGYRGGTWISVGFGYASAPGYSGPYYLGFAPPPCGYPRRYDRPRYAYDGQGYGYYRPAYAYDRPHYYPRYDRRSYYERPHYGHAYYGHADYARAYPRRGWRG